MPAADPLPLAVAGDTLSGADLQAVIDSLLAMAAALDAVVATAASVDDAQAIGRIQQRLRSQAGDLAVAQIDLLVGQVKISAGQITDAVGYCNGIIGTIADWRRRIGKIGALCDFLGVVLTGRGGDILKAAAKLKSAIDA